MQTLRYHGGHTIAEGAIPGFRKEEDGLKLLKLRKLEEGPMEVGFTSQTTKETEKGLLTWSWCLWAGRRDSVGPTPPLWRRVEWSCLCKCWKNLKPYSLAALERNCIFWSEDVFVAIIGIASRNELIGIHWEGAGLLLLLHPCSLPLALPIGKV